MYSRGSAKSNTQTLFSHLVRTDARVYTRRSSNLLITIEQLSDGKLSYSCSLGPFPCSTIRSGPSRILSTCFYLPPLRCRAFTRISFQASDCTTNCIEPEKERIIGNTPLRSRQSRINSIGTDRRSSIISICDAIRFLKRRLTLTFIYAIDSLFLCRTIIRSR